MKIKSTLKLPVGQRGKTIIESLRPDNLANMESKILPDENSITLRTEKLSSLISVMDDLLMNAKIAEDLDFNGAKND
ncbi:MAG: hypothetical protein AWU58_170 [Methanohalophilus sp. T328-1]|jgi:hypothetical protein|uniref:Uncharacterized protein n=2 Tax=Methanohalophilus TaxID=2175 RepID=A0A285EYC4_9EURY|nr:MAG: hypothetical protein AWU58_170 [Methanohalophilus sp. T328-1]OBZ36016.1 MAG: hypothetical protein A9957_04935 [Methanohalophilus sp. DAL1]ODV50668.1 MAG: hypothetical protein A8273_209 [Methanohalophilus sp. 2-GBenrich]PQV43630.1 hypothetical protein B0H22_10149 [Methanohalophilus euhalobius]RSD34922.1 MAG: hypothetical protein CI953_522 [Methanohalophilus sp.]RXG34725.1 hypothetical protein CI957_778 [Methanohalophilus sp. WG1-DM]